MESHPLLNEFFSAQSLRMIFNIVAPEKIEEIGLLIKNQLQGYIDLYVPPLPIDNIRFERRTTIKVNNSTYLLNPTLFEHFRILQLADLETNVEDTIIKREKMYVSPRANFRNEYHLPIAYRIKFLLNNNENNLKRLKFLLAREFCPKVGINFIDGVLFELDSLNIISIKDKRLDTGCYFGYFF